MDVFNEAQAAGPVSYKSPKPIGTNPTGKKHATTMDAANGTLAGVCGKTIQMYECNHVSTQQFDCKHP